MGRGKPQGRGEAASPRVMLGGGLSRIWWWTGLGKGGKGRRGIQKAHVPWHLGLAPK